MKNSRPGKDKKTQDNLIKDVRIPFRIKIKIDVTIITDMQNLFRLKKENETIKDIIIKVIRNLFEHKEEDYYQPISIQDRIKTLSVEEYLNKIRTYLKGTINDLRKSDASKI